MDLIPISRRLTRRLARLKFAPPIEYVYNPLTYAKIPWEAYLTTWARPEVEAVLLGMNPGPFGMAQTGVPFGEVNFARDWLGLEGKVGNPKKQHPKRPILGFACTRSEVSGARIWGWAKKRFSTPERFFQRFFVFNYCPLVFMEESGRNRTPDKLPKAEREPLFAACDEALRATVEQLSPKLVIGVGAFAETRAREALDDSKINIGRILHPSPANPRANKDWAGSAEAELKTMGIHVGSA
jgi:single-strand selective monofunctional uracil DNA glycosylase